MDCSCLLASEVVSPHGLIPTFAAVRLRDRLPIVTVANALPPYRFRAATRCSIQRRHAPPWVDHVRVAVMLPESQLCGQRSPGQGLAASDLRGPGLSAMGTDSPIRSIRVTFTKPLSAARSARVLSAVWRVLVAAGLRSSARLWCETTAVTDTSTPQREDGNRPRSPAACLGGMALSDNITGPEPHPMSPSARPTSGRANSASCGAY